MICDRCGTTNFRTSRLRLEDIMRLLAFGYPVRCRTCYTRLYVSLMLALRMRRAEKAAKGLDEHVGKHRSSAVVGRS